MDIRKNTEDKVKKFLAKALKNKNLDIYTSAGKASPSKLVNQFKKETGLIITRQTMAKYLKDDLSSFLMNTDFSQNIKIKEIMAAMEIAKELYENVETKAGDKTKAMNAWRQLNQQRIDYEQHLRELEIRKVEASRPNFLIKFEPGCAEQTCPNCGHKFYIGMDEIEEKKKTPYFKTGNGQTSISMESDKDDKKE